MRTKTHPPRYPVSEHFPDARIVRRGEGGWIRVAERAGRAYVIVDEEGSMADFLDADDPLLDELVKVHEFDTVSDRDAYLRERYKL